MQNGVFGVKVAEGFWSKHVNIDAMRVNKSLDNYVKGNNVVLYDVENF